jgi:hypothetical protein
LLKSSVGVVEVEVVRRVPLVTLLGPEEAEAVGMHEKYSIQPQLAQAKP